MATIQQLSRTQHTSSSGIEITRDLYVKPYDEFQEVTRKLQGSVTKGPGENDKWVRTPPERDTYIKNCYCNESLVKFAHPDAMASSEKIETLDRLHTVPEVLQTGAAGAIITAHYRPLITAWQQGDLKDTEFDEEQIWDWLDPIFAPGVRFLPWPDGLFITDKRFGIARPHGVPESLATPFAVPIVDISIRRTLVGEVPVDVISALAGALNDRDFPDAGPARNGLGLFKARTLKIEPPGVKNMLDADGKRWVELTIRMKWIPQEAAKRFDMEGNEQGAGPITWNHVFLHPSMADFQGPTGWYEVWRSEQINQLLGKVFDFFIPGGKELLRQASGRLYSEGNLMKLFELNP